MAAINNNCNKDLFWKGVGQTKSNYSPNEPVIVQEKQLADKAKSLQAEMFAACTSVDRFAEMCFSAPPEKILDLGAGLGANAIPMAKGGAHVTAIEKSKKLLRLLAQKSVEENCPKENLRLRRGDITKMESYDGPFDLVLAVDVLPYIHPKSLQSTMEKIHKCLKDKGILIGTLFTTDQDPVVRDMIGQVGGHFYENGQTFVPELLKQSGFVVKELEVRPLDIFGFKAEKVSLEQ